MLQYKEYTVRPFENPQGRWLAEIRRIDGRKLFIPSTQGTPELLTTTPPQLTQEDAIRLAKEAIDGGGIKLAA